MYTSTFGFSVMHVIVTGHASRSIHFHASSKALHQGRESCDHSQPKTLKILDIVAEIYFATCPGRSQYRTHKLIFIMSLRIYTLYCRDRNSHPCLFTPWSILDCRVHTSVMLHEDTGQSLWSRQERRWIGGLPETHPGDPLGESPFGFSGSQMKALEGHDEDEGPGRVCRWHPSFRRKNPHVFKFRFKSEDDLSYHSSDGHFLWLVPWENFVQGRT